MFHLFKNKMCVLHIGLLHNTCIGAVLFWTQLCLTYGSHTRPLLFCTAGPQHEGPFAVLWRDCPAKCPIITLQHLHLCSNQINGLFCWLGKDYTGAVKNLNVYCWLMIKSKAFFLSASDNVITIMAQINDIVSITFTTIFFPAIQNPSCFNPSFSKCITADITSAHA